MPPDGSEGLEILESVGDGDGPARNCTRRSTALPMLPIIPSVAPGESEPLEGAVPDVGEGGEEVGVAFEDLEGDRCTTVCSGEMAGDPELRSSVCR